MRRWPAAGTLAFGALLLFALFFVFLSIDIMLRIWSWRARFEQTLDVAFLLYMESMRIVVTLAGAAIAVIAARRSSRDSGALALGVVFLTIAYTKLIAFDGFPGERQEQLALWLRARGVSRDVLGAIFGHPEWALWLALAGLLLFAVRYPRPIVADDIGRSGAHDRAGALRSVAVAGADIGALARAATTHALQRGWLTGGIVWSVALVAAGAHTVLSLNTGGAAAVHGVALLLALLPLAMLVALLRADVMRSSDAERPALLWLQRGALAGLALFAAAAILTQLVPELPAGALILSIAPALIACCCLIAVLRLPRVEASEPRGYGA